MIQIHCDTAILFNKLKYYGFVFHRGTYERFLCQVHWLLCRYSEEVGGGRSQFDEVSVTVLLREEVTFFDFLVVA